MGLTPEHLIGIGVILALMASTWNYVLILRLKYRQEGHDHILEAHDDDISALLDDRS